MNTISILRKSLGAYIFISLTFAGFSVLLASPDPLFRLSVASFYGLMLIFLVLTFVIQVKIKRPTADGGMLTGDARAMRSRSDDHSWAITIFLSSRYFMHSNFIFSVSRFFRSR